MGGEGEEEGEVEGEGEEEGEVKGEGEVEGEGEGEGEGGGGGEGGGTNQRIMVTGRDQLHVPDTHILPQSRQPHVPGVHPFLQPSLTTSNPPPPHPTRKRGRVCNRPPTTHLFSYFYIMRTLNSSACIYPPLSHTPMFNLSAQTTLLTPLAPLKRTHTCTMYILLL